MYKSSPFTFVFKYIFPVFMLVGIISEIYFLWTKGSPESQGFAKANIVVAIWVSIFLVQMPFRLKNLIATDKAIIIKDIGKEIFVEYKKIDWITKFDLSGPLFITIKYHVTETGEYKKISYIPNQSNQRIFGNDEMTEFIKEKIISENPGYSKESQPSQIKNFIILLILSLPFMLFSFYFIK